MPTPELGGTDTGSGALNAANLTSTPAAGALLSLRNLGGSCTAQADDTNRFIPKAVAIRYKYYKISIDWAEVGGNGNMGRVFHSFIHPSFIYSFIHSAIRLSTSTF
jgi:hypothetical protein